MSLIEVNGTRLFCDVSGAGEPAFLLLNGANCPLETWDALVEPLARRARVIRFDGRGSGRSAPPEQAFSLETMAQDGVALLDSYECDRAVVVGHAFGGRVAQVLARDFPDRVRALIVCGTGGQFPPAPHPAFQVLGQSGGGRDEWQQAMLAAYCGDAFPREQPERALQLAELLWQERARGGRRSYQGEAARLTPSPAYWATATMPALLVYGSEDRNGTRENAEDLASRLADARLVYVEGAGHMAIWEQPADVYGAIEAFMQEHGWWS